MTILTSTTSITRIIKRASGNPSYEWANTYETALISGPGSISDIQNFLLALKQAEVDMHTSNVEFVRAIYSTWAPDSEPYDPSSFLVLDLGLEAGGRIAADDVLPRNFALHAKRSALTRPLRKVVLSWSVRRGGSNNQLDLGSNPRSCSGGGIFKPVSRFVWGVEGCRCGNGGRGVNTSSNLSNWSYPKHPCYYGVDSKRGEHC